MQKHMKVNHLKYMTAAAAGIFLLLCIFMYLTLTSRNTAAARADAPAKTECYMSVKVNTGDSLWEISRRYYSSEYKSLNRYIRKIMNLNHMPDGDIHAGAYLIIPYYEQPADEL